jgi:(2R)-sulfolactate sulfo-lyase subunit alpha
MSNPNTPATAAFARAILLHPDDNVLVCVAHIRPGDQLTIDGNQVIAADDIGVGHKLARFTLNTGDKIFKYGAPVGSMTATAAPGAHVHMHNMQSDYIPSHTRTRQNKDRSES